MVESGNLAFSIAEDAAAVTAMGRLEYYTPERDLGTLVETGLAADALLAKALARGRSIQPVIMPADTDPTPFVDYTAGDTIDIDDPDEGVTVSARIAALTYAVKDGVVTYEPALSAETFVGSAAVSQGVRQLLEAQDAIRREPPEDSPEQLAQEAWGEYGEGGSGAYLHLSRSLSQSIAIAGEEIEWDTFGLHDTVGFGVPVLPLTQVVIVRDGYYNVAVQAGWDSHTDGGTMIVYRTRAGVTTVAWPPPADPGLWTSTDGQLFEGEAKAIPCQVSDIIEVFIDHDDGGSAQDLASATGIFYLVDRYQEAEWELIFADDYWGVTLLGSNWWTTDHTDDANPALFKLDLAGTVVASYAGYDAWDPSRCRGIVYNPDDGFLYGTGNEEKIHKINPATGAQVSEFVADDAGVGLFGMAYDGTNLFVTETDDDVIMEYTVPGVYVGQTAMPVNDIKGITDFVVAILGLEPT